MTRLVHGDCLGSKGLPSVESHSVDMILCDLPYGKTSNRWDSPLDLGLLWKEYERVTTQRAAIVLFAMGDFVATLITSNRKLFRYDLIWEKSTPTGFLNANRMPLRCHETILVFYKSLPSYNPQKTYGHPRKVSTAAHKRNSKKTSDYGKHGLSSYDSTNRFPRSVIHFPTDKQKSALHPTQKPVELCSYLIRTFTNEGDLVLDNCFGSGTTAVSCVREKRNFVGFEKDYRLYRAACRRVNEEKS